MAWLVVFGAGAGLTSWVWEGTVGRSVAAIPMQAIARTIALEMKVEKDMSENPFRTAKGHGEKARLFAQYFENLSALLVAERRVYLRLLGLYF
jgi:hypothetical protein